MLTQDEFWNAPVMYAGEEHLHHRTGIKNNEILKILSENPFSKDVVNKVLLDGLEPSHVSSDIEKDFFFKIAMADQSDYTQWSKVFTILLNMDLILEEVNGSYYKSLNEWCTFDMTSVIFNSKNIPQIKTKIANPSSMLRDFDDVVLTIIIKIFKNLPAPVKERWKLTKPLKFRLPTIKKNCLIGSTEDLFHDLERVIHFIDSFQKADE